MKLFGLSLEDTKGLLLIAAKWEKHVFTASAMTFVGAYVFYRLDCWGKNLELLLFSASICIAFSLILRMRSRQICSVLFCLLGFFLIGAFSASQAASSCLEKACLLEKGNSALMIEVRSKESVIADDGKFSSVCVIGSDLGEISFKAVVTVKDRHSELLTYGEKYSCEAFIIPAIIDERQSDEQTEMSKSAIRKGASARVIVKSHQMKKSDEQNMLVAYASSLRNKFMERCMLAASEDEASLMMSLYSGDTAFLKPGMRERVRIAGLSHMIAASGLHVGLAAGFIMALFSKLSFSVRKRNALCVVAVIFYAQIASFQPSIIRALTIFLLAIAAFELGRSFDFLCALSVSAIAFMLVDPCVVNNMSFQLSYAACLSIACLQKRIERIIPVGNSFIKGIASVTLAAQIGTFPIIFLSTGEICLVSVFSNTAAMPFVGAAVTLSFIAMILTPIGNLSSVILMIERLFVFIVVKQISFFSALPIATLGARSCSLHKALMLITALAAAGCFIYRQKRKAISQNKKTFLTLLCASLLLIFAISVNQHAAFPELYFLDVGQGDAALIISPDGAKVLVDTGERRAEVYRIMSRMGLKSLDLIIISHPHADHCGGLEDLLDCVDVCAVICPIVELSADDAFDVEGVCKKNGVKLLDPQNISFIEVGDIEIEIIDTGIDFNDCAYSLNDRSCVVRIEWSGVSALFTGDLEQEGQDALIRKSGSDISCRIMKMPHHGGKASEIGKLLDAAAPEIAVISCGRNNMFGHPSEETLDAIRECEGIRALYRTDMNGNICFRFYDDGALKDVDIDKD